jgi:hypothetical protein
VQNVFDREVYKALRFETNKEVIGQIERTGVPTDLFKNETDSVFKSQQEFRFYLGKLGYNKEDYLYKIFKSARIEYFRVDSNFAKEKMSPNIFSQNQINSVKSMHNEAFQHRWKLVDRLKLLSEDWKELPQIPANEYLNKELYNKIDMVCGYFEVK